MLEDIFLIVIMLLMWLGFGQQLRHQALYNMSFCMCKGQHIDIFGAVFNKSFDTFICRGTSGENIIDKQQIFTVIFDCSLTSKTPLIFAILSFLPIPTCALVFF
jgi:hypothetical protein